MPYSLILEQRLHEVLDATPQLIVKKMFGGIAFMVRGNMTCGVHGYRSTPSMLYNSITQPMNTGNAPSPT
jgi:hypothetical protein